VSESEEEGGGGCSGGVGFWVSSFFPSWHTCAWKEGEDEEDICCVLSVCSFFWWPVASTTSVGPECTASNSFSCWEKA
jgi:hypothetical protein